MCRSDNVSGGKLNQRLVLFEGRFRAEHIPRLPDPSRDDGLPKAAAHREKLDGVLRDIEHRRTPLQVAGCPVAKSSRAGKPHCNADTDAASQRPSETANGAPRVLASAGEGNETTEADEDG